MSSSRKRKTPATCQENEDSTPVDLNSKNKGDEEAGQTNPFPKDPIAPKELGSEERYLKIISWNVAGLRGVLAKDSTILERLVDKNQPDILCLQVVVSPSPLVRSVFCVVMIYSLTNRKRRYKPIMLQHMSRCSTSRDTAATGHVQKLRKVTRER